MRFNEYAAGRPAVAKVQKQYGPDLSRASLREGLAQARDLLFASSYAGRALRARPIRISCPPKLKHQRFYDENTGPH